MLFMFQSRSTLKESLTNGNDFEFIFLTKTTRQRAMNDRLIYGLEKRESSPCLCSFEPPASSLEPTLPTCHRNLEGNDRQLGSRGKKPSVFLLNAFSKLTIFFSVNHFILQHFPHKQFLNSFLLCVCTFSSSDSLTDSLYLKEEH